MLAARFCVESGDDRRMFWWGATFVYLHLFCSQPHAGAFDGAQDMPCGYVLKGAKCLGGCCTVCPASAMGSSLILGLSQARKLACCKVSALSQRTIGECSGGMLLSDLVVCLGALLVLFGRSPPRTSAPTRPSGRLSRSCDVYVLRRP